MKKLLITNSLTALFLVSGIDSIRAEEMMIPSHKAAFSAGYVHEAQKVCPQIKLSATLQVYIDTTVDFEAPDRELWRYYDKGKESVRGMSSNKLKHAIFCLRIGMAVEEIDKVIRSKAGVGDAAGD